MLRTTTLVLLVSSACASAQHPAPPGDAAPEEVGAILDDWHAAAANADEARYFDHFASDGIFLGTDATERWTVAEFRAYAHPHFERGAAWAFRAARRDVTVEGPLAWFDEDLETENLGPARGSGVLRYENGRWRIVQYNLALTIPNERFAAVRATLTSSVPPPPSDEGEEDEPGGGEDDRSE